MRKTDLPVEALAVVFIPVRGSADDVSLNSVVVEESAGMLTISLCADDAVDFAGAWALVCRRRHPVSWSSKIGAYVGLWCTLWKLGTW